MDFVPLNPKTFVRDPPSIDCNYSKSLDEDCILSQSALKAESHKNIGFKALVNSSNEEMKENNPGEKSARKYSQESKLLLPKFYVNENNLKMVGNKKISETHQNCSPSPILPMECRNHKSPRVNIKEESKLDNEIPKLPSTVKKMPRSIFFLEESLEREKSHSSPICTPQFEKREICGVMNIEGPMEVCKIEEQALPPKPMPNSCINFYERKNLLQKENSKEDYEAQENIEFKYVVVKNLKDSSNYFRFINNCSQYMAKLQKDKHWVDKNKNKKILESVQKKIDNRINIDFSDALHVMNDGKRFVFIEIENTICKVTEEPVEECSIDPLVITLSKGAKGHKNKAKRKFFVYIRKFGLEFLEFLCLNHEVILYTHLEKDITEGLISTFHEWKEGIDFAFVICGKPFYKSISNKIGPIKSLNKIIPSIENLDMNEEEYTDFIKSRFLILDCEVLSYLQNFEDVHVPILPIKVQDDLWLSSLNMPRIKPSSSYNKIKRKHLQRRQSSLKDLQASTPYFTFEESLKNHCLFYLKQLLSQSLGLAQDNSELLRSVSISCLVNH
ncbi:unnamed protein product [Moneuplotes crassus]|uniref:FCP1 homology domain-containing protein n=2 Tax=Euplotes crassus TaxID=5936 RepID=A0AAD1Y829_EUPCR|nr:unnamed protein product [Moneuplotes crassus]